MAQEQLTMFGKLRGCILRQNGRPGIYGVYFYCNISSSSTACVNAAGASYPYPQYSVFITLLSLHHDPLRSKSHPWNAAPERQATTHHADTTRRHCQARPDRRQSDMRSFTDDRIENPSRNRQGNEVIY